MSTYAEFSPKDETPTGRLRANRLFAAAWDFMSSHESATAREIRKKIVGNAAGRVLEIGCGTGANFAYYSAEAQVVATEPDSEMLKRARRRMEKLGMSNVELRQAAAEAIPFDDASFDYAVSSWVFCHVDDAPRALAEIRRLLKPGGALLFMEHVRDDNSRFWRTTQDMLNPIWRRLLGAGCNLNRRTRRAIEDAGFHIDPGQSTDRPLTSPTIYGVARIA